MSCVQWVTRHRVVPFVVIAGTIVAAVAGPQRALAATGTIVEYSTLTAGSQPNGIMAGPDGNVWFTEYSSNKIGRVTPAGAITEFTVPTTNSGPRNIASGPDGNLWFTEYNAGQIGKITTAGVVTEYSIPTASSGSAHITAGPDGNLWFAENTSGRIGEITTAGVATDYAIPTAGSAPVGIAPGPDGKLWFTENSGNNIGEISTTGVVQEFTAPTAASGPQRIFPGADGGLWFTEQSSSKVGRITPGPASLVLSLPSGFTPKMLVAKSQAVTVQWLFLGPGANTVTDPSGMALFSSPPQQPGTSFSFAFNAAGTYTYKDALTSVTGKVAVPVVRSPHSGTTTTVFTIGWPLPHHPPALRSTSRSSARARPLMRPGRRP